MAVVGHCWIRKACSANRCRFAIRHPWMLFSRSFRILLLSLLVVVVHGHIVPQAVVGCPLSSSSSSIFSPSRSRGSLILLQHDILSCGGGWCTRGRQRQRWPNGRSCQWVSTTFLVMLLAARDVRIRRLFPVEEFVVARRQKKYAGCSGGQGKVAVAYLEKRRCFGRWS